MADKVWNDMVADFQLPGSFGKAITDILAQAATAATQAATAASQAATAAVVAEQVEALTTSLHDVRFGEWVIDDVTKQLIYKSPTGVELRRFNLFDKNGEPSIVGVTRRVPVEP